MADRSRSSGGVRGWFRRRRGGSKATLDLYDPSLTVTVTGYDPALSCGAALAAAGIQAADAGVRAVLRQLVVVPPARLDEFLAAAELDGYTAVDSDAPAGVWPAEAIDPPSGGAVAVTLCRAMELTGLACSQEQSRIAGLAQRYGGDAVGWDGLRPAPEESATGR